MNRTTILAFGAGSIVTAAIAVLIAAGPEHDHGHDHDKGKATKYELTQAIEMSPEEMMAGMMRLATPNEHHAHLMNSVGSWSAKTSFVMDPTQPATEAPAKMSVRPLLDGRYAMGNFSMDFAGQPFEGFSIIGYDNAKEEYISVWMDSMSTRITYMTGNMDDDGNLVMLGTSSTPMGENPMKIVSSFIDDDHMTDRFYDQMPDGSWFNSGTIAYTRD